MKYIRLFFCIAGLWSILLIPGFSNAKMIKLNNKEMDKIVATSGFAKFDITNDIARATLNMEMNTYTEIDTFKAGHYENDGSMGWDQNWENVSMEGSGLSDNLSMNKLVFETKFSDIDADDKQLERVTMGFEEVNGEISADNFHSFSRLKDGNVENYRDNPSETIVENDFEFNNDKLKLTIDLRGDDKGIYVDFGDAEF